MTKKAEAELGAPKKPVESNATGNSAKLFLEMAKMMTNHNHLFIEPRNTNLPQAEKHLYGSYTTFLNIKRKWL